MLFHLRRHLQHHLRQVFAVLREHVGIGLAHHMQHHIIIMWVAVVTMGIPVGRAQVQLHIAHPQRATDAHLRVEEVGSSVAVVQPWVNHLHLAAVGGGE